MQCSSKVTLQRFTRVLNYIKVVLMCHHAANVTLMCQCDTVKFLVLSPKTCEVLTF